MINIEPATEELLTVPLLEQLEFAKVRFPVSAKVPSDEAVEACVSAMESVTEGPPEPTIGPFQVPLMEGTSAALMQLRPVTFHYKTDRNPAGRTLENGYETN